MTLWMCSETDAIGTSDTKDFDRLCYCLTLVGHWSVISCCSDVDHVIMSTPSAR